MKNVLLITFITLSLISCSQKKGESKSTFKIIVGASAMNVPLDGGAWLETENNSGDKTIIKLDADNSAVIPLGHYNLLFIAFAGPVEKTGTMYCGAVANAALISPTATVQVTLSAASCPQSKYTDFKNKLLGNSTWDTSLFDQGKWGP